MQNSKIHFFAIPYSTKKDREWNHSLSCFLIGKLFNDGFITDGGITLDEDLEFFKRNRLCVVITLNNVDTQARNTIKHFFRFNAFLDNGHAHFIRQGNNRGNNLFVTLNVNTLGEEYAVELQLVHRKLLQNAEGRIADTKVVDRATDTALLKLLHDLGELRIVLNRKGLGKLKRDQIVVDHILSLVAYVEVNEIVLACGNAGNVDGDRNDLFVLFDCFAHVFQYFKIDEMVHLDDKAVCFEQTDKVYGVNIIALTMVEPTNERLGTVDRVGLSVVFRLEEKSELVVIQRVLHLRFDLLVAVDLFAYVFNVDHVRR